MDNLNPTYENLSDKFSICMTCYESFPCVHDVIVNGNHEQWNMCDIYNYIIEKRLKIPEHLETMKKIYDSIAANFDPDYLPLSTYFSVNMICHEHRNNCLHGVLLNGTKELWDIYHIYDFITEHKLELPKHLEDRAKDFGIFKMDD